jgi:hypothetical protein
MKLSDSVCTNPVAIKQPLTCLATAGTNPTLAFLLRPQPGKLVGDEEEASDRRATDVTHLNQVSGTILQQATVGLAC